MNFSSGSQWAMCIWTLLACAGVLLLCGCNGRESSGIDQKQRALTYGYGPDPKGSAVYQPDVVIVEGGANAIRSASANGLVWTIDGNAKGARELSVGKIMFATSRAVGRVARIEHTGDDLAVTLAPVQLTDLIRDAHIAAKLDLKPESVVYQYVPDLPGVISDSASDLSERLPAHLPGSGAQLRVAPAMWAPDGAGDDLEIQLVDETQTPGLPQLGHGSGTEGFPFSVKNSMKVTVGAWDVEPYLTLQHPGQATSGTLGLKVALDAGKKKFGPDGRNSAGLKLGFDVALILDNLQVDMSMPVANGRIGASRFIIRGIDGLDFSFWGGAENGNQDNQKIRIEVPVELNFPVPPEATDGIPFIVQLKFKFFVESAFVLKNSSMYGTGKYGLSGPIGFSGASAILPKFTVLAPLTNDLQGITLGGAGVVVAVETRFFAGVGTPEAMAGIYAKVTPSFGVAMGSSLGYMLGPTCRGVTIRIDAGGGVGVQMSREAAQVLQKWLGASSALQHLFGPNDKEKTEFNIGEISGPIVNNRTVWPDTPLCKGR